MPPPQTPTVPTVNHVVILVMENESYEQVIGSASLPYFNSLVSQYGLATNYFADAHSSLSDYFMLTTGQIIGNNTFTGTVTDDNVVRQLVAAGKTWKCYAESLPSVGYVGGDVLPYVKRHNPFAYFADVLNSPDQRNNLVPFTQLAADLANSALPAYSFIVPNQVNNMHDCDASTPNCTLANRQQVGDKWLHDNLAPLIASPVFQNSGILVLTFDESDLTDMVNGGGHIATLIIGSKAKAGYKSSTFYRHASVLRLSLQALGLSSYPGAGSSAPTMEEFFQ